ncbi:MAG: hypothetical protein ACE5LB_14570 [Acidiferrobacterales bacterium]
MVQVFIRRVCGTLCTGEQIQVTILAIEGSEVRLAVEALTSMSVQAKETDKSD